MKSTTERSKKENYHALYDRRCSGHFWLLGLVTSSTMGGFIHVLLVIAIVVVLLRVISGRKAL